MVAFLLVLAGCGSAGKADESTKAGSDAAKGSTMVGDCSAESTQVTAARKAVLHGPSARPRAGYCVRPSASAGSARHCRRESYVGAARGDGISDPS